MPKKSDIKKNPRKYYLSDDDLAKLQELLVYFHKNSSDTISTCLDIAYKKMKNEDKQNDLETLKNGVIETQNWIIQTKQDFEAKLNEVLKSIEDTKQSSIIEHNKRISDINSIITVIKDQPVFFGRDDLAKKRPPLKA